MRTLIAAVTIQLALLISASSTAADFAGAYVSATDSANLPNTTLDGFTTYTFYAAFEPGAHLLLGVSDADIALTGPALFQFPFAGDTSPYTSVIEANENVAADSYITGGAIPGSAVAMLNFDSKAFNNGTAVSGGWLAIDPQLGFIGGGPFNDELGLFLVPWMQLTFADGGGNEWAPTLIDDDLLAPLGLVGSATLDFEVENDRGRTITDSHTVIFIPAPSAIAMLGIAALAGWRRRRSA